MAKQQYYKLTGSSKTLTMEEAAKKWTIYCRHRLNSGDMPVSTFRANCVNLRLHILPFIGGVTIGRLNAPRVQQWISDLAFHPVKPRTANVQIAAAMTVKRMLTDFQRQGIINVNIIKQCKPQFYNEPAAKPEMVIPSREDLRTILKGEYHKKPWYRHGNYILGVRDWDMKNSRIRAMIRLALFCGLRRGEVLGLHWQDIDFQNGTIKARYQVNEEVKLAPVKSRAGNRTVPMPGEVSQSLVDWYETNHDGAKFDADQSRLGLVFCNEVGGPLPHGIVDYGWRTFRQGLSLNEAYSFHTLRHACVSLLREQDVTVEEISKLIGHSSPSVTLNVYSHIFEDAKKGRSAIDNIAASLSA